MRGAAIATIAALVAAVMAGCGVDTTETTAACSTIEALVEQYLAGDVEGASDRTGELRDAARAATDPDVRVLGLSLASAIEGGDVDKVTEIQGTYPESCSA